MRIIVAILFGVACELIEADGVTDADLDGWTVKEGDCDDINPDINPGTEETWYDYVDQDCSGAGQYPEEWMGDFDQDGDMAILDPDHLRPEGWPLDCDDEDPTTPDPRECHSGGNADNIPEEGP